MELLPLEEPLLQGNIDGVGGDIVDKQHQPLAGEGVVLEVPLLRALLLS